MREREYHTCDSSWLNVAAFDRVNRLDAECIAAVGVDENGGVVDSSVDNCIWLPVVDSWAG